MHLKKVKIENFKCFKGSFSIDLKQGLNILVGDNESGKSTILESIHLALTGFLNGKYLKNDITQSLFNNDVINEYIDSFKPGNKNLSPPTILIEVFICGDEFPIFEGDGNSDKKKECGIVYKIAFNDIYNDLYEKFVENGNIKSIPIEFYDVFWESCSRETVNSINIPIKSALIDSSSYRYQNGSDIYVSHIVKNILSSEQKIHISQAHRQMLDDFMVDESIKDINEEIKKKISDSRISKEITLEAELSSKNAWENNLVTYVNKVPFQFVGKGEQSIIKTKLALERKNANDASIILLEEPENHLSHTNLNYLISLIKKKFKDKQILISTHSSFVSNKLGLENIIILSDQKKLSFVDLSDETINFFKKISGYDTLRLILCSRAILVEGDSDELIVQRAFMDENEGNLPIEKGIDVISVGTSFLRFLEIAEKINKQVTVVTDNDGDVEALMEKYKNYLGEKKKQSIKICFDEQVESGDLLIGAKGKPFNYNTLEPKLLKVNDLETMNLVFGTKCKEINEMHKYMRTNKTECAMKIFDYAKKINFPQYILESIK